MLKSVHLFRVFGFGVKADASWIFLSILIVWTLAVKVYPHLHPGMTPNEYQLMGLATLAGVLLSVVVHEVAHALIAEYYHMPVAGITLFMFGGVAEMNGEPSHPRGEFMMAFAGPLATLLLALFFGATADTATRLAGNNAVGVVMEYLGRLNFILLAFNLLPAFPLDGGRMLRAALWQRRKNFVQATRTACQIGAWFAYATLGFACYLIVMKDSPVSGMWTGIFGLFALATGGEAVRQSESRALLRGETVARFMTPQPVSVAPSLTLGELVEKYASTYYQRSFPVVENGRLAGVIFLQPVLAMDRTKWQWLHVASVMEQVSPQNSIAPDASAAEALDRMQRDRRDHLLVVESDGRLSGAISQRDLLSYLSMTMKIDSDRPLLHSR